MTQTADVAYQETLTWLHDERPIAYEVLPEFLEPVGAVIEQVPRTEIHPEKIVDAVQQQRRSMEMDSTYGRDEAGAYTDLTLKTLAEVGVVNRISRVTINEYNGEFYDTSPYREAYVEQLLEAYEEHDPLAGGAPELNEDPEFGKL